MDRSLHSPQTRSLAILLLLLVCSTYNSFAQLYNRTFDRFGVDDGLSSSTVFSIIQDQKGFMWFATGNGLCRFDGYKFKSYFSDENDIHTLSSNEPLQVAETPDGYIWIITRGGDANLNRLNPHTGKITRFGHDPANIGSISSNTLYNMYVDKQGNLIVNADGQINFVDKDHTADEQVYFNRSHILSPKTWIAIENAQGQLLIVGNGLFAFNRSTYHMSDLGVNLQQLGIGHTSIGETGNQDLWIGRGSYGVARLAYNKHTKRYSIDPNHKCTINTKERTRVMVDEWDRVWVATENLGLWVFDTRDSSLVSFANNKTDASSISDNTVYGFCADRSGVLWLGTFSQGICTYDLYKKQFFHYKPEPDSTNSLSGSVVSAIHGVDPKELWVGIDLGGGVNRITWDQHHNPTFTHYKNDPANPNSLGGDNVLSLCQQRNGTVWVGSAFFKTTRIVPGQVGAEPSGQFTDFSRLGGWRFTFFEDSNDTIWTGTYGDGLIRLNTSTEQYTLFLNAPENPESLADNVVWATSEDRTGNIWVGGRGQGISIIKATEKYKANPKFINLRPMPKLTGRLSNGMINVFCHDKAGNMWIGTANGLAKATCKNNDFAAIKSADDITITTLLPKDGLPSNSVLGIEEDDKGNLWISTAKGLSKFNITSGSFLNFYKSDGLQGNEFWHNAYFKDANGRMFFGGNNGFTAFYPDSIKLNPFVPQVEITDLKLYNQSVRPDSLYKGQKILSRPIEATHAIELGHLNNMFTIEFAALHFTRPEKNLYAYKMDGFDKDWIKHTAERRYATYTNLPAGSYTFMIKASNCDQLWNTDHIKMLHINILPPWWETLWFRLLVALAVISSALGFYLYRVKTLKRRQQVLEETVRKRTLELSEANVSLIEKQEEIIQQNKEILHQKEFVESQKQQIERAYANMQSLSEFGQQLTATLQVAEISSMIYEHVAAMVDIDVLTLGMYQPLRKTINFVFFIEQGRPHAPFLSNIDDPSSLAAWCIKNQKVAQSNDFEQEYRQYISELNVKSDEIPRSIINLPLIIEQRAIGVLSLQCYRKNAFSEQDFTNIRSLASYMAIALDNAKAYQTIAKQNGHIKDSIAYAQTIQNAILPTKNFIAARCESFVLFKPKDIVSGDFYWSVAIPNNEENSELFADCPSCTELFFIAVVDCTGHGVPGAFMSMIGSRLLSEIVTNQKILDPKNILTAMDNQVMRSLKQKEGSNNDGMDLCLLKVFIEPYAQAQRAVFAGAKCALYHYRHTGKQMIKIPANRKTIGGRKYKLDTIDYEQTDLLLNPGDAVYLTSDGFADQNRHDRKRFSSDSLRTLLAQHAEMPMTKQLEVYSKEFDDFKGDEPQRDDVTLIGLRF